jgi:hypothetical protein
MSKDTVSEYRYTEDRLREDVRRLAKPLEEAAFAAGERAGLAEANELVRLEAILKTARQAGLVPASSGVAVAVGKTPVELAKRARQLQIDAHRDGHELSNIESVKAAFAEAGIALK